MATHIEVPISLEPGDHLTREEFHRRYCARPDIKKAELIDGVVHVPSPVRALHGGPHFAVTGWLYAYLARIPVVRGLVDTTVLLDAEGVRDEVQPDACLWVDEPGGPRLTEDHYLRGAPQLVVEVAASSASYDLHEKMEAYRRNGVGEYIVWRVYDRAIDWFELRDGVYVPRAQGADGIIESSRFPGLRLHVPSMLAGDAAGVLAALGPVTNA
ncbi:MAG TPA: Uma2 family endonuclease [Chloroflexota bacterium]|nr:Uma2 family endonuclease [Chloroflexota bacterium]